MPNWAKAAKGAEELASNVMHLGRKPPQAVLDAIKARDPMLLKRLESVGSTENGGRLMQHLNAKFGTEEANAILREGGVDTVHTANMDPRGLPAAAGMAAMPMAGNPMNPFQAFSELNNTLVRPVVNAYEGVKDKAASAVAQQLDLTHGADPGFQKNASAVIGAVADPTNFIPGAPGAVIQGVQAAESFAHGGAVKILHRTNTHTVVQHPDGHEVKLNHAALKPEHMQEIQRYAEGGEVNPQIDIWSALGQAPTAASASVSGPMGTLLDNSANKYAAPDATSAPMYENPNLGANPTSAPSPGTQTPVDTANPGADQMMRGIQGQANAVSAQGQEEKAAAMQQEAKATDLAAQYTQNLQSLDAEHKAIMQDIGSGHIDPDHYINSMSTGNKVGTAIGLILGGFAPAGTKNPAMEYLQKQIDHDVQAQKADLGRKENLLSANMRQYGNLHDAMAMTKAVQNEIYASKIAQAAASAKSPIAQAAAQQAMGQLRAQTAPLLQQVAQRQTAVQGLQSGAISPAQAVPLLVPKEHQKDVFNQIDRAVDTRKNASGILQAFDDAAKETRPMSGGASTSGTFLVPGMNSPSVKSFHAMMGPTFKDIEGTVRQAAMDNAFENMTPQAFDNDKSIAKKRAALQSYLTSKSAASAAQAYGIDLDQLPGTSNAAAKFKPAK